MDTSLSVSCEDCEFDGTSTCDDCVVSYLLNREADDAIIFDASVARAVHMLNRAGLVPELRHRRRTG